MADRRILKYELVQQMVQTVEVPKEFRPLRFGNQGGTPTLWAEANPSGGSIQRVVFLAFTGEDVPEGKYVGTAYFGVTGEIVIHCYIK